MITGNTATENGGGVYTAQASLTNLKSIDIGQNSAKNGAGLCTTNIPSVVAAGIAAQSAEDLDFKVDYVVTANVTKTTLQKVVGAFMEKRKDLSSRPPKYYWELCRKIRWRAVFHRSTDS